MTVLIVILSNHNVEIPCVLSRKKKKKILFLSFVSLMFLLIPWGRLRLVKWNDGVIIFGQPLLEK